MESVLALSACALLSIGLTLVVPVIALVSAFRTRARITDLERRVVEIECARVPGPPAEPAPVVAPPVVTSQVVEPAPPPSAPPPIEPPPPIAPIAPPTPITPIASPHRPIGADALGVWALAIPGGLALLLAAIFALREAIAAGFVGPGVRFALGAGVGMVALLTSEFARYRRYDVPAAALGGGGAGIFYAVLYAGHARYGLIEQPLTFALMVATTVITLVAAERRNSRFMAALGLIGGYLTPLLLSTGENKAVAFFTYLGLLDAALLWAAGRRRWAGLTLVAAIVTSVLYAGWAIQFRAPDQVAIGLLAPALLGGLFLLLPAQRASDTAMAWTGYLGGLLLLACGLSYLIAADPLRYDPVSSLALPASDATAPWLALAFLVFATLVPARIGVRRADRGMQVCGVLLVMLLLATFTFGQLLAEPAPWLVVASGLALAGPLFAAAGSSLWPGLSLVGALLFAAASLAGASLGDGSSESGPPMWIVAAFVAAGAVSATGVAHVRGPRFALAAGVLAAILPLLPPLAGEIAPEHLNDYFLAAAVAYALYVFPPFWRPRQNDLWGALSAALAGPFFFFPFRAVWLATLGSAYIGVLPLLLGFCALIAAITLVRAVRVRADDRQLAVLVIVVLLFAAAAVPLQLSNAWLTVGWAGEVALLAVLSRRLTHPSIRVFAVLLSLAVGVRLLLNPDVLTYGGGEGLILLNWTLYTYGVPAVCLLVAAHFFTTPTALRAGLRTLAVLLIFALINLEVAHAFAQDDVLSFSSEHLGESMTRSIAWAAYGLVLIGVGIMRDARGARFAGLCFALLGAAKVFAVDLWSLSGFARVGSFAGLAVTLLVGAVAFQRIVLKDRKP